MPWSEIPESGKGGIFSLPSGGQIDRRVLTDRLFLGDNCYKSYSHIGLDFQSVVHVTVVQMSSGSLLEMHNVRPKPRSIGLEPAFSTGSFVCFFKFQKYLP